MITAAECGRLMGLTRGQVARLCRSGALRSARKIEGRWWLLSEEAVALVGQPRRRGWPKGKPRKEVASRASSRA